MSGRVVRFHRVVFVLAAALQHSEFFFSVLNNQFALSVDPFMLQACIKKKAGEV